MPSFASAEGYINSYKEYPQNNYTKTLITIASYREKDKEGKNIYDYIDLVHYNFGSRFFDLGDYVTVTGDIRSYKDQDGKPKNYINVKSLGVDPTKHREPKERPQNAPSAPTGSNGFSRPASSPSQTFSAPTKAPEQKRRPDVGEPKPIDYSTAKGPEFFEDSDIPF